MGRKYRQRGYQDGEHEGAERRAGAPREPAAGPRGRGLGAPVETRFRCARCGAERQLPQRLPADARCDQCGADLHSCTNCRHFDTAAINECRLPVEQPVSRKARANECPEFEPKLVRESSARQDAPDDAKAAFDALFDL